MAAFPLTLLALAAGTYLLLKAKKELMGKAFEWLAWLIIVLSILYIIGLGLMGWHHHRMMHRGGMMDRGMMMHRMGGWQGPGCCMYNQGMNCCGGMQGCCGMNTGGGNCCNGNGGGGSCCSSAGGSCGMMGHDMSGCCMSDSSHTKDGKGACCIDGKKEEKKK